MFTVSKLSGLMPLSLSKYSSRTFTQWCKDYFGPFGPFVDHTFREPMQASLIQLRQTVEVYERQATNEKWGELWRVRADVTELDVLAKAALDRQKSRSTYFKGMERFSTVALEYSKLLDVVMNQCPEYVSLAWGVTKLLLVANINHSKLKQNVESHLVSIGGQLGLVNQLIAYSPTEKMVEYEASEHYWLHVLTLAPSGLWLLYMQAFPNF